MSYYGAAAPRPRGHAGRRGRTRRQCHFCYLLAFCDNFGGLHRPPRCHLYPCSIPPPPLPSAWWYCTIAVQGHWGQFRTPKRQRVVRLQQQQQQQQQRQWLPLAPAVGRVGRPPSTRPPVLPTSLPRPSPGLSARRMLQRVQERSRYTETRGNYLRCKLKKLAEAEVGGINV